MISTSPAPMFRPKPSRACGTLVPVCGSPISDGWGLAVLSDKLCVTGHGFRGRADDLADASQLIADERDVPRIHQRVVALRPYILADVHRQPARWLEELIALRHEPAI